jgi:capsular exopolysaccharide synthesis family protein
MQEHFEIEQESSLTEIVNSIRKHFVSYWRMYLVSSIIGLLSAVIYLRYASPIYVAQAKILVKSENKSLGIGTGGDGAELDLFGNGKVVDNELEIIKSRPVIGEAIKASNSMVKIFRDARVRNIPMKANFPFAIIPLHPDSILTQKEWRLKFNSAQNAFTINEQSFQLNNGNRIKINNDSFLVQCNNEQIKNWNSINFLITINTLNQEINDAINLFDVKQTNTATSIVAMDLKTLEPSSGLLLLNQIVKAYNRASLTDKRMIAQFTLDFIADRLALVANELDSVEKNLENYKSRNEIVDISEQSKVFLASVQQQDQDLNKIGIQISVLEEVAKYMKGKANNPGTVPSLIGIEDPMLLNLLPKLYEAEFQWKKQQQITGERDDATIVLQENVVQLKKTINGVITNLNSNLLVAQARTKSNLDLQNNLLKKVPSKERALVNISRQQAIKNSIYTLLLEKREESAIAFASTVSDTRLIEPCYCTGVPVSPKKGMLYLIGIVLGLLIPMLYILIREKLNTKIQFKADIQTITKLPIIGEIMYDDEHKDFVISEKSRSVIAEAFRAVRTKLNYYLNAKDKKVLLVSSSIPGEGKSFFTLNLGRSYALTGRKTLLVTADMRKPSLHKVFNLSVKKGLSNYLVNMANPDEIIYGTGLENLSIIPVGPLPPNPSELLAGNRMTELITQLRNEYDVIIIDTPPLGLISDPELIAPLADACVFLTRHDHTQKEILNKVMQDVTRTNVFTNISLIFNGVKTKGLGYRNYYGYGYGYGYKYMYGQESKSKKWKDIIFSFLKRK